MIFSMPLVFDSSLAFSCSSCFPFSFSYSDCNKKIDSTKVEVENNYLSSLFKQNNIKILMLLQIIQMQIADYFEPSNHQKMRNKWQ